MAHRARWPISLGAACSRAQFENPAASRIVSFDSRWSKVLRRESAVRAPFDVNAVMRNAIRLAELDCETQVALRASFFRPLPLVEGSPHQLAAAICSLLVSARKSLEGIDGGAIEIETEPDGDLVAVRILDNGPGMPAGLLERIFDPFRSDEKSADEPDAKRQTDGFELSEACEILRDHGGTLTVRSRPGEGTCFVALIPARRG